MYPDSLSETPDRLAGLAHVWRATTEVLAVCVFRRVGFLPVAAIGNFATPRLDRILVVYGAGHLGRLQQDIASDATVKLRKLADFTGHQLEDLQSAAGPEKASLP